MKIRSVGAELFRADGRAAKHDEANSRFSNFVNARKNKTCRSNTTMYLETRKSATDESSTLPPTKRL